MLLAQYMHDKCAGKYEKLSIFSTIVKFDKINKKKMKESNYLH